MVFDSISFTNPYSRMITFKVQMTSDAAKQCRSENIVNGGFWFEKGNIFDVTVKPYDTVHIPFMLRCRDFKRQIALVTISLSENIKWTHRLVGEVEMDSSPM